MGVSEISGSQFEDYPDFGMQLAVGRQSLKKEARKHSRDTIWESHSANSANQ